MTAGMDEGTYSDGTGDPLALDEATLRELGYWVVDRTIEHLRTLPERPAITERSAADLDALLGGDIPRTEGDLGEGLRLLADVALEAQQHGDHPRYFARVPGPSSPVAVLGAWLATGMQGIASSWGGGSGTATLELTSLRWLRDALGLAPDADGVLLSGGSMASTTALIVARAERGDGVLFLSDQTHSSIMRGALGIGWNAADIVVIPTDERQRLDPHALADAIGRVRAEGRRPAVVVATAGTTNTGAVDDIPALAAICREQSIWLHVDGAYGGPAALTASRHGVAGLDLADSFVLDPHKWLFQPYDIACLWVAHPGALERTFAMHPEYLADVQGAQVDLHNRTLELTRHARAAKLWLTLRTYGLDRIAAAIEHGIASAEHAQRCIERGGVFEVVTPASLGVVTFALPGGTKEQHAQIAARLTADGYAALTSTVIASRSVLRICAINPRTTAADIDGTIARTEAIARDVAKR